MGRQTQSIPEFLGIVAQRQTGDNPGMDGTMWDKVVRNGNVILGA